MEQKLARMEANYKAEIEALKAVRMWLRVVCMGSTWAAMAFYSIVGMDLLHHCLRLHSI